MSKKTNSKNTKTGSVEIEQMSQYDAAAMIISTAISMQNENGLPLKMRNIPGRGFAIVIDGWYFDGRNLSRQPPENLVANSSGNSAPAVVAN